MNNMDDQKSENDAKRSNNGMIGFIKKLSQSIGRYFFEHEDESYKQELINSQYFEEKKVDYVLNKQESFKHYKGFVNYKNNSLSLPKQDQIIVKPSLINDSYSINTNATSNKKTTSVQRIVNHIIRSERYLKVGQNNIDIKDFKSAFTILNDDNLHPSINVNFNNEDKDQNLKRPKVVSLHEFINKKRKRRENISTKETHKVIVPQQKETNKEKSKTMFNIDKEIEKKIEEMNSKSKRFNLPSLKSLVEKEEKEKITIIKEEKKNRSEKLAKEFQKCKDKLTDEVRIRFEKFKKKSEEERKKMINNEKETNDELFKKPEAINKITKNEEEINKPSVSSNIPKETNSSLFASQNNICQTNKDNLKNLDTKNNLSQIAFKSSTENKEREENKSVPLDQDKSKSLFSFTSIKPLETTISSNIHSKEEKSSNLYNTQNEKNEKNIKIAETSLFKNVNTNTHLNSFDNNNEKDNLDSNKIMSNSLFTFNNINKEKLANESSQIEEKKSLFGFTGNSNQNNENNFNRNGSLFSSKPIEEITIKENKPLFNMFTNNSDSINDQTKKEEKNNSITLTSLNTNNNIQTSKPQQMDNQFSIFNNKGGQKEVLGINVTFNNISNAFNDNNNNSTTKNSDIQQIFTPKFPNENSTKNEENNKLFKGNNSDFILTDQPKNQSADLLYNTKPNQILINNPQTNIITENNNKSNSNTLCFGNNTSPFFNNFNTTPDKIIPDCNNNIPINNQLNIPNSFVVPQSFSSNNIFSSIQTYQTNNISMNTTQTNTFPGVFGNNNNLNIEKNHFIKTFNDNAIIQTNFPGNTLFNNQSQIQNCNDNNINNPFSKNLFNSNNLSHNPFLSNIRCETPTKDNQTTPVKGGPKIYANHKSANKKSNEKGDIFSSVGRL